MQLFSVKVFDQYITGTSNYYTSSRFNDQLGSVDRLIISGMVLRPTGTNPTLTIQIEQSPDGLHWIAPGGNDVNAAALPLSNDVLGPVAPGTLVAEVTHAKFRRLRIALGGTSPAALLRIWLTGRDPVR